MGACSDHATSWEPSLVSPGECVRRTLEPLVPLPGPCPHLICVVHTHSQEMDRGNLSVPYTPHLPPLHIHLVPGSPQGPREAGGSVLPPLSGEWTCSLSSILGRGARRGSLACSHGGGFAVNQAWASIAAPPVS